MSILDFSLGWLADLIAQHVYLDDVPKPQRRRWNLHAFTVVDDPAEEWLDVTPDYVAIAAAVAALSTTDPQPVATGTESPGTATELAREDHTHRFGFPQPADGVPSATLEYDSDSQTAEAVGLRIQETDPGPGESHWVQFWDATNERMRLWFTGAASRIEALNGILELRAPAASEVHTLISTSIKFIVGATRVTTNEHLLFANGGGVNIETLSANKTIAADSAPHFQKLNTNGSNRDVTLPAEEAGLWYWISGVSGGLNLVVKDDGGGTIVTVTAAAAALVVCNGTNWAAFGPL